MTQNRFRMLCFINQYIGEHGRSPTYQEIGTALGFSVPYVWTEVVLLEDDGYVARGRKWRSLQVLRMPAA